MFSNLAIILSVIILIVVMLSVVMLKEIMLDILAKCYYSEFCYSKCYTVLLAVCRLLKCCSVMFHLAECCHAECPYAECHYTLFF